MAESFVKDLTIADLLPLANWVAAKLRRTSQIESIVSDTQLSHVSYPTGRADETQRWRAVFDCPRCNTGEAWVAPA